LLIALLLTLSLLAPVAIAADDKAVTIAFTADTEGHTGPCRDCPMHVGRGGLDRRATALTKLRAENSGALLVLDGGNTLFGPDSLASRGRAMIDGYNLLDVDALNVSWRDFRFGKQQTLELLKEAKFAALSANLLDAGSSQLLFKPYVVKQVGATKIAVIGLTQAPAGMDVLTHLKQQLAGVKIRDAAEALGEWLPKAKAESDRVVLMYYGTPTTLAPIREKFAKELTAICIGGARPEEIGSNAGSEACPIVASDQHGKDLAIVSAGATPSVRMLAITPDISADPRLAEALAKTNASSPTTAPAATSPAVAKTEPPAVAPTTRTTTASSTIAKKDAPATRPAVANRPRGRAADRAAAAASDPKSPRVPARPNLEPKGIAAVGLKAEDVNRAIDRGADFLWATIKKEDFHGQAKIGTRQEHILCCLALVHAGAHKRHPDFDAALRDFLGHVNANSIHSSETYQSGLLCMLVEAYGDAEYLPKLELFGRYLMEAQGNEGSWGYGPAIGTTLPPPAEAATAPGDQKPLTASGGVSLDEKDRAAGPEPWRRVGGWDKGESGDSSNTQYALLGLNSVARTGIKLPEELWQRCLKVSLARQADDGGFGYSGPYSPYGSMSCAGICAVAMTRHWLGEEHPEEDVAVERGLAWMDKNFAVEKHPGENDWHYYYLYSLERVGRILDTEFIGQHEWYPLGARWLVDAQRADGAWVGKSQEAEPRLATSFALLFLTRATPTLNPQEKRGGDGVLLTRSIVPSNRIYIILDASGSMLDEMGGKTKFDIARSAVEALVKDLPENSEVALRVYGSKKRAIEVDADADTELLVPLEPLDRAKFLAALRPLRARGKTPLAQSLHDAASDLGRAAAESTPEDPITVLLLTDGGEDTRPRKDPVKAALELSKLKNVQIKIVGFDINREDWTQQLRAMADAAGGRYWSAGDAETLMRQVRDALAPAPEGFDILDANGQRIAAGKFGDRLTLREGKYALRTSYAGQQFNQEFWINTERTTSVSFNAAKIAASGARSGGANSPPATAPATSSPPKEQPPPNAAKFCTHCGAKLPPNAKFCTACGAKVQ
jgi:Mg-chelatase subunit ChlD